MPLLKPARIEINTSGKSLSALLADGEVDAIISAHLWKGSGSNPTSPA